MNGVPPIRIDPETGLKIFNTRVERASEKVTGKGYSLIDDKTLTTLPEPAAGAVFNAEEQARYREFKDLRRGSTEYVDLQGQFASYLEDVLSKPPIPREPLTDACDIVVVGAGFAALLLWYKLKQAGFTDVRICEKGGDVGGTWYWNRYPGIACDVEAYSYLPLLEEMNHIPSMKFASGFEILEYCQKIAQHTVMYDHCLFHTAVTETVWDGTSSRWVVQTDRGDAMRARIVVLANGLLSTPKLARIEGMETFKGASFHTARWNYEVDLKDKRIGVIGTGATAVQLVPELAKVAKELYVFQRTPSTVDVRDQRATTPEEYAAWSSDPHWAKTRRERFALISAGRAAMKANDDFLSGKAEHFKERKTYERELTPQERLQKQLQTNFRIMEQIRARVDAVVKDPATAAKLKPYYEYGCKRPTFHDEYLPTFNLPHVHLVDTAPRGVGEIDERGVVHDGVEYPLDVLIYATGFYWLATGSFNTIKGRKGETLREKWTNGGVRTFIGVHSSDFPNLLILAGPQAGGGQFNYTRGIETQVDYLVWVLKTMRDNGAEIVDVRPEVEVEYAAHCRDVDVATAVLRDCRSYFNHDGKAEPGSLAYYGGAEGWNRHRVAAQQTLDPYIFEAGGSGGDKRNG
jgi:cation diffusion facilitator CzcD-associated flavoprotein CzcO